VAEATLLLREDGLRRDLPLRTEDGPRPPQATGEALGAPEIAARAERGDAAAKATLARYEDRMARALAVVLDILDPHVVVLGGGMSQIPRLYETVPRLWQA
jgi:fructokinase